MINSQSGPGLLFPKVLASKTYVPERTTQLRNGNMKCLRASVTKIIEAMYSADNASYKVVELYA